MEFSKHIKVLGSETDWPMWKRKIRDLLDYHEGALDVIDKKIAKPEPLRDGAAEEEIKKHKQASDLYRKANSYAKSMIASSVTDEVYQKIMDQESAAEAWDMLKINFEATSKDQLFKVCSEFFSFGWTQGESVSSHIAKLKTLWLELNNGLKVKNESQLPDLLLVCKALHILPKEFETFKSSWMILTKDESRTFDELTNQLCMFERNFLQNSDESRTLQEALVAKVNKGKFPQKFDGKGKGKDFKVKSNDLCNYCNQKGHWVKNCQKWFADGKPSKTGVNKTKPKEGSYSTEASNALMSISEEVYVSEPDPTLWWIDNGATKHVTNCPDYFTEFERFDSSYGVKSAGKETLTAIGKGTIQMSNGIKLVDVWFVPEVSRNLFSVLAAQDRNPKSQFKSTATKCQVEINNKVLLRGTRKINGSLFKADFQPIFPQNKVEVNVVEDKDLVQLYHERWGHQDKRHVREMLTKQLSVKLPLDKEACEPCIYGKAHRLPFGHREKLSKPGELMSADVCGPFDESFQKKKYLILFKDSYTKFRYGFLIREKSEVKDKLIEVIQYTKTQGYKIQELLSDNGGEFDNKEVRKILNQEGIVQRLTAPYTPQQNGNTEREMRTVVEMARTFKFSRKDVEFPAAMWAELVAASIYILNRTGKSSVNGKTPYELWMGKKPRIKHLRIIGSTCYVHVPAQKRRKMDRKAIKGYLVGYDGDERYRIWIKEQNKIVLSRDVIFQERLVKCENQIELSFRDKNLSNQGKESDTLDESRNDIEETIQDDETDIEEEDEEDERPFQPKLRDRSKLKKPTRFEDFVMITEEIVNGTCTPETYEEAISSIQQKEWKQAMDREIKSLEENQTWELTVLPKGAKAIPSKWVYRLKTNPDGTIEKYKARLVIKGFNQRYEVDYKETFSPVAKMSTIRSMLSVAASEGLHLMQFDVSTAFLYGELEEDLYMQQPKGYTDNSNRVCKLKRSLYGLKQAPRCWTKRFGGFLLAKGFKPSHADQCLYIKESDNRKVFIALYVDDGLVMTTKKEDIESLLQDLKSEFKITTKPASYFLGIEIEHIEDGGIKISQKAYAKKVLERFNFQESKPVSTPMLKEPATVCSNKEDTKKTNFPYRQAVGALMYLMIGTRPDLAYSVSFLSRSLETPTEKDVLHLKRVLRYVQGTSNFGIVYRPNTKRGILECYSDADFGGCDKTGRSTSGVVIKHAGGAISWHSQRQAVTATSTTEAELIAATEAVKEIIWLKRLFQGLTTITETPVLQVDNQATVRLVHNPEFHQRTKHIKIKYFFVREKVTEKEVSVDYIPTEYQLADMMTKALPKPKLVTNCEKIGLAP